MHDRDFKTHTIISLFWKLFEQGGAAVISLVVQVVMARLLAPHEFGMLAIMLVFVNVGNVIVQSGLNTAVIQAPNVDERDFSSVFWMSLVLSLVLFCGLFAASPVIAAFYEMPEVIWPLRALLLVLIINAYNSIQEAIVSRNLEFQKTFRATVIAGLISGVIGIGSAVAGAGIWALVIQQILYPLTKCIALAAQVPWKPRVIFDPGRALVLFRFGWKLLVSGLLDQGYQSLSDLIIGKVFTSGDLGLVSQGKKYPQALGTVLDGAIQPVMLSAVAKVQDDSAKVKRLARRALKTSTFLIVPAMTAFALVAEPLVELLLGEKWLPCVPFVQMYCFIYALLPIHTTNLQVLNGVGRSDLFLGLEIIKVAVCFAIMLFTAFVLRDLAAIVIGYMVNGVICTFVNAAPNKRVIGYAYHEQLRDIIPAFGLSAVAGCAALPLVATPLFGIALALVQCIVFSVVYLVVAYVLRVEELRYLLATVQEFKMK